MSDKEIFDLIESLQNQLDSFEMAIKEMHQMHTIQSLLLFRLSSQLNPEQAEEVKGLQKELKQIRQRFLAQFDN